MILVTGGTGMIGAHTARALVDLGQQVVVTSRRRGEVPVLPEGTLEVEHVDVTDREALLRLGDRYEITDVVHLAGSVPEHDPVAFFRQDLAGLLNVLDAARTWQVRRCAVASSIGVYAGRTEVPWREELELPDADLPHLIVAFKKAVEPLTVHGLLGSDVAPVILRIGSTWGPLMDPESPFNPIPPYLGAALRGEGPRPWYADDSFDCCYAPDAGRAIALLLTADVLHHRTYNVSSGVPVTGRELVEATRIAIPEAALELVPGRSPSSGNGPAPYLDTTRLARETGFAPAFDIAAAVADYVDWRRGHPR